MPTVKDPQRPSLTKTHHIFFLFSLPVVVLLGGNSCGNSKVSAGTATKGSTSEPQMRSDISSTTSSKMAPQLHLPRTMVTIQRPGKKAIIIEAQVAVSPAEQAKGLMFRRRMPQSEGMLFIYNREQTLGFYMANCFISLDMIFLDADHKVIGMLENAQPMDETVRSIGKPSQYVLEVNGGFAARHSITPGTVITWREWRK